MKKTGAKSFKKKSVKKVKVTAKRHGVKKSIGRAYNPQVGAFSSQRKSRMSREAKDRAAVERRDARAKLYEADGMSPEAARARAQRELWKKVATPVMSDGRDGPQLELRGLFERFFSEVQG